MYHTERPIIGSCRVFNIRIMTCHSKEDGSVEGAGLYNHVYNQQHHEKNVEYGDPNSPRVEKWVGGDKGQISLNLK